MCASNTPHCRSPPRSGSSAEDHHVENGRFHQQQHPAHQPPYIYYPPPVAYQPLNPYGPYGPYHSGGYYPHPYCTEPTHEPKSSGTSLIGVILFVLLILCVISIVLYRLLPRESRRRLDARLPILTHPPVQTRKTKRDANQNFPAEFLVFSKFNRSREKVSCEGCEDDSVTFCDADECLAQGIIEISPTKKVNAGTDTIESTGTRSTGT